MSLIYNGKELICSCLHFFFLSAQRPPPLALVSDEGVLAQGLRLHS